MKYEVLNYQFCLCNQKVKFKIKLIKIKIFSVIIQKTYTQIYYKIKYNNNNCLQYKLQVKKVYFTSNFKFSLFIFQFQVSVDMTDSIFCISALAMLNISSNSIAHLQIIWGSRELKEKQVQIPLSHKLLDFYPIKEYKAEVDLHIFFNQKSVGWIDRNCFRFDQKFSILQQESQLNSQQENRDGIPIISQ
ncbi:hypothetical protein pb186bvf_019754 [Paramecium bursaria]